MRRHIVLIAPVPDVDGRRSLRALLSSSELSRAHPPYTGSFNLLEPENDGSLESAERSGAGESYAPGCC